MKAITLWQPWATLLACGAKQYETRSWATKYRGPIAIHASIKTGIKVSPEFAKVVDEYCSKFPLGYIIATAELVDCHKIVRYGGRGMSSDGPGWLETEDGIYLPTEQELLFGDWTPGRYAWEVVNVKMLPEPIPAKGHQRLWNWEVEE